MHEKCPGQSLGSLGGSAGLVTQNVTADYFNTMGEVIMYTLSFEYHIQGIS